MENISQLINPMLPYKKFKVHNTMLEMVKRALKDYQHDMIKQPNVDITPAEEGNSDVVIWDFNDNDLMLFGYYLYRTCLNTETILAS